MTTENQKLNIIKEQHYETLKQCPFCNSDNIKILFSAPDRLTNKSGKFHLSQCTNCKLAFQNPRIKEEYISEFYTTDLGYYNPPTEKTQPKNNIISKIKKYIPNFIKNRQRKIDLMPQSVPNGKLLEIGCSHGQRLEQLKKRGWQTYGIEMDENVAKYAREKRKLDIKCQKIEEAQFSQNEFDVIIMSMVLEHLYNPFQQLKTITNWLKPNGQLLISIPYFEGLEFQWFKDYSYGLQLPYHITFLNKKILKKYLHQLGYKNIKFYFQYFDRDIVASAHYKYLETKKPIYKFIASNKLFRKIIIKPSVFILSLLGKTSRVSIVAIKK